MTTTSFTRRGLALAALLFAGISVGTAKSESAALYDYGKAPEFVGIESWLNSDPLTMESLKGKVVLVDFWTYSCINCLRTLPHVKEWAARYKDQGLVVIGMHTPEFAYERVRANLETAMKRFGVTYPVAQDNRYATWKAYDNAYWPSVYLIDRRGHIMLKHVGEGAYAETEAAIRTLLAQPAG